MNTPRLFSELSRNGQKLVKRMQEISFGRIEALHIRGGEPVFDPAPRVIRKLKLGSKSTSGIDPDLINYTLKSEVARLFAIIADIGDGQIQSLTVQDGLPFLMEIADPASVA